MTKPLDPKPWMVRYHTGFEERQTNVFVPANLDHWSSGTWRWKPREGFEQDRSKY